MKNVIIPAALVGSASAFPAVFDLDTGKHLLSTGTVSTARTRECGNKNAFIIDSTARAVAQNYFAGTVGLVTASGTALNKLRNWCETGNADVEPVDGATKFCTFTLGATPVVLAADGEFTVPGGVDTSCVATASEKMDLAYYSFAGSTPTINASEAIAVTANSIVVGGQANAYQPAAGKAGSCREQASLAVLDASKTACEATAQNDGVCKWDGTAPEGSRCLVDTTLQSTWTFKEVKDLTGDQQQVIQNRLAAIGGDDLLQYAHEGIQNMTTKPDNYPTHADISTKTSYTDAEATAVNAVLKPVCDSIAGSYTAAATSTAVACSVTGWTAATATTVGLTDAQFSAAIDLVCQKLGDDVVTDAADVTAIVADINAISAASITGNDLKQDYCNDLTKFLGDDATSSAVFNAGSIMDKFPATSNTAETQRVQNISLCKYTSSSANVNASTAWDNECKAYAPASTTTSSASSVSALSATAAIAAGVMFAQ